MPKKQNTACIAVEPTLIAPMRKYQVMKSFDKDSLNVTIEANYVYVDSEGVLIFWIKFCDHNQDYAVASFKEWGACIEIRAEETVKHKDQ